MARRLGLIVGLALAGMAAAEDKPRRPGVQCGSDRECTITTFSGCCGGCCPQARAMAKAVLAQQQARCAAVDCEAPMCAAVVCEPGPAADTLVARCTAGRCVAEEKPPPPGQAECQSDRECTVTYPEPAASDACRTSPCGCCPGTTPVATTIAKAEERKSTPSPAPRSAERGRGYGLSQGSSGAPQPACAPCPPRPHAIAVCKQGRCGFALPRP